jgi:phenylacetate-CoA ligase
MDFLAPISRRVVAPLWAAWERSPYLRHHRRLLRTQYDSLEMIEKRQLERLRGLVRHAFDTCRFWRARLTESQLTPERIQSFADFRRLPLLTKADLRQSRDEMLSSKYRKEDLHYKKTSGSTGTYVEVFVDDAAQQFKRGCTLRSDEWSGWRLGQRIAAVWGNPEYLKRGWRGRLRNALLERHTYLDTLKMNPATIEAFVAELRRRPPSLLFGHAHSLYLVAEYLESRGDRSIRPKGIISTAMVLHDWQRRTIEDVFQCKVTNRYGCEEVSLIASECGEHDGLHVNSDCIYLEILRPDGSACRPGEAGMIIVTDLLNRGMPMLRYQVGDMGTLADRRCNCGRGLPLLEKIEGRIADYVVTTDGEMISGISLTENFAVMVPGVAQLQIVQEEVDRFVFRVVKSGEFGPESLRRIGSLVTERFGPTARYECEFLDRIPQEPSGKYRFCISKVSKQLLGC